MSKSHDLSSLVEGLELAMHANEALENLIGQIGDVFHKCSLVQLKGLFDDMAALDAINEIDLCITASGEDDRVARLCRHALKLARIPETEIRIEQGGRIIRRMIYFARNGRGLIKIGSTQDVAARLSQLETGAGEKLELLLVLPGSTAAERRLHAQFDAFREHGEWFRSEQQLTNYIIELQESAGRLAISPQAAG